MTKIRYYASFKWNTCLSQNAFTFSVEIVIASAMFDLNWKSTNLVNTLQRKLNRNIQKHGYDVISPSPVWVKLGLQALFCSPTVMVQSYSNNIFFVFNLCYRPYGILIITMFNLSGSKVPSSRWSQKSRWSFRLLIQIPSKELSAFNCNKITPHSIIKLTSYLKLFTVLRLLRQIKVNLIKQIN